MSEYHFPIPGSADEGQMILFIRRHWASFLGQSILSILMILVPAIVFIALYFTDTRLIKGVLENFLVLGLSIYYLIAFTVAFIAWISFYYDIYVVSTEFIIDVTQEGFWGRKISQISLLRVQDVTSNIQGFLPTFFGYGDVLVETAGEQTQHFVLKSIANPQEVAAKIMELHNKLIETEGRHHQVLEAEGVLAPGNVSPGGHHAGEGHPISKSQEPEALQEQKQVITENNQEPEILKQDNLKEEGEVSGNDLDKGGEIDLK